MPSVARAIQSARDIFAGPRNTLLAQLLIALLLGVITLSNGSYLETRGNEASVFDGQE